MRDPESLLSLCLKKFITCVVQSSFVFPCTAYAGVLLKLFAMFTNFLSLKKIKIFVPLNVIAIARGHT